MYLDVAFSIRPLTYGKQFRKQGTFLSTQLYKRGPRGDGRVVSASDTKSGSPRFESRSDHFAALVLSRPEFKSSTMPGNSKLIASCQLFFNPVMFSLDYLFPII